MLNKYQKIKAVEMYEQGIEVKNIAHLLNKKLHEVKNFLYYKANLKTRRQKFVLMSEVKQVRQLREDGLTVDQIIKKTGFKDNRVRYIVTNYCDFTYNQVKIHRKPETMDQEIIDIINKSGYKQEHLAKMIGVTGSYFSRCKNGDKKLSEEKMQKLKEILVS